MDPVDQLYITILADGIPFLIPVFWISNIKGSGQKREEVPMIDLVRLVQECERNGESPYILSLSHKGRSFDLAVQKVGGFHTITERMRFKLPDCVQNSSNQYLVEIVPLEHGQEGKQELAYILNLEILYQMAADEWAAADRGAEE